MAEKDTLDIPLAVTIKGGDALRKLFNARTSVCSLQFDEAANAIFKTMHNEYYDEEGTIQIKLTEKMVKAGLEVYQDTMQEISIREISLRESYDFLRELLTAMFEASNQGIEIS